MHGQPHITDKKSILNSYIRIVDYNLSSVCSTYVYTAVEFFYGLWLIQPRLLPLSFPTLVFIVFLIRVGHILVIFVILWPRVPCFASRMFASRATPTFGQVQNRAVPIRGTWQQSWQCASIFPPKNITYNTIYHTILNSVCVYACRTLFSSSLTLQRGGI